MKHRHDARMADDRSSTVPLAPIDFDRLWRRVTAEFHSPWSIHGPHHWRRVEQAGLVIAQHTPADIVVVRLFAVFHDSRRVNDGHDPGHGARGALYAQSLRGQLYDVTDAQFDLLHEACTWHTDRDHHTDPTIAACFDADRLDLGRVGITPSPRYMSTAIGKAIAQLGSVERWLATKA